MIKEKSEIYKVLRYIYLSVIPVIGFTTIVGAGSGGGVGRESQFTTDTSICEASCINNPEIPSWYRICIEWCRDGNPQPSPSNDYEYWKCHGDCPRIPGTGWIDQKCVSECRDKFPDNFPPITSAVPTGGVYDVAQEVTLEFVDNRKKMCPVIDLSTPIRYGYTYYTTDGSVPTTSSMLYTAPIVISEDTILRFFTDDCDGNLETVNTESYVISAPVKNIIGIIGTWSYGIRYWDESESKWTMMASTTPTGDIAAGDFTGDSRADVASCWSNGLYYQDGYNMSWWTKLSDSAPVSLTAGDVTGDGRFEIIGTWSSGIWYWDVVESEWTRMTASTPTGDIAAGDFTGDGKADVASIWSSGLWYQDGATLDWTKVGSTPNSLTAGDVTGDGRAEIIGTWSSGIWYWDVAVAEWTRMTASTPTGDIAAGDFTGDGKADVASIWSSGLWYQDGATLDWTKVSDSAPVSLTAGDVTWN